MRTYTRRFECDGGFRTLFFFLYFSSNIERFSVDLVHFSGRIKEENQFFNSYVLSCLCLDLLSTYSSSSRACVSMSFCSSREMDQVDRGGFLKKTSGPVLLSDKSTSFNVLCLSIYYRVTHNYGNIYFCVDFFMFVFLSQFLF